MDAAKAIAMGAALAGMALPVIRAVVSGGAEAVVKLYRRLEMTLRIVMLMTGSRTTADLRRGHGVAGSGAQRLRGIVSPVLRARQFSRAMRAGCRPSAPRCPAVR